MSNNGLIEVSSKDNLLKIAVKGPLNESSTIPNFSEANGLSLQAVSIDLNDLTHINSPGIKLWLNLIHKLEALAPKAKIVFQRVPTFFISQAGGIIGLIPNSATVESLYVGFYDEETETESLVLFSPSKQEYEDLGSILRELPVPEIDGRKYSLDHIPEVYFKFLLK